MEPYKIVIKPSVRKDLKGLPKKDILKILEKIESLSDNPRGHGCEKLSGQERYRVRQGVYRILYEIENKQLIVTVVKVAHRSVVYKH